MTSRLRDADVAVFRTDIQGDIVFTSDGVNLTVRTEKNPDIANLVGPHMVVTVESTSEASTETTSSAIEHVQNINAKKFHYPTAAACAK